MDVFEGLIDDKLKRVLKVFLEHPKEFYHINHVAKTSKVPLATTFRIINALVKLDIIEITTVSKFKIYALAKNKKTKKLRRLL